MRLMLLDVIVVLVRVAVMMSVSRFRISRLLRRMGLMLVGVRLRLWLLIGWMRLIWSRPVLVVLIVRLLLRFLIRRVGIRLRGRMLLIS